MQKMVMFETLEGRCAPAQWWRDTRDHQALQWLGRGVQPSRTAWYDFRDRMGTVGTVGGMVADGIGAAGGYIIGCCEGMSFETEAWIDVVNRPQRRYNAGTA